MSKNYKIIYNVGKLYLKNNKKVSFDVVKWQNDDKVKVLLEDKVFIDLELLNMDKFEYYEEL